MINTNEPEKGRMLSHELDAILDQSWRLFDEWRSEAGLDALPTRGNRFNVLMAMMSTAAYDAFVAAGIEKRRAMEFVADIGWNIYAKFIVLPRLIARVATRDPQKRVNIILRFLLIFPFSTPGRPGYELKTRIDGNGFHTDWTHCPPLAFVRRHIETYGDKGELDAFRQPWCGYDWAFLHLMVGGKNARNASYTRTHTMSEGDDVCDMCWSAKGGCAAEKNVILKNA